MLTAEQPIRPGKGDQERPNDLRNYRQLAN